MKDWSEKLQKTFGLEECPHALFYEFEFALRFELGGEHFGMNQPIRRFLQAYQRANSIAETVFGDATNVQAFIKSWGDSNGPASDFSRLKFVLPKVGRGDFTDYAPSDVEEDAREFWHVTPISDALQIRELIWLDIAREMPVEPASYGHNTWLVDFEHEIIFNAYDDRGLDVISTNKAILQPLYEKFADWLHDYDRKMMDDVFKEP